MRYVLQEPISLEEKDGLLLVEIREEFAIVKMTSKEYKYDYGRLFRRNRNRIPEICKVLDKIAPKYTKPIYSGIVEEIFEIKSSGEKIPKEILEFMILLYTHSPSTLFSKHHKDKFLALFSEEIESFAEIQLPDNYIYQPQEVVNERMERWELEDLRSGMDNWIIR